MEPLHPPEHWERVREEVARMLAEVPAYRSHWQSDRAVPGDPQAIARFLKELPIIQKRDLRRGFPKSLVRAGCDLKKEMEEGRVEIIPTSGTTEDRLQVLWEWVWWDPQERQAMRLNGRLAETMTGEFREAVLTTPVCGGNICHIGNLSVAERTIDGMLFLNQTADPSHWSERELDRMAREWNDLAPHGVEADPAYLAALCRHAGRLHAPRFISLTYEQATRAHVRAIRQAIDAPLYSLYGATEAGVLFMECTAGRLHHNAEHSHIELLEFSPGIGRVLVTTLGRTWMPLLRYQLGDVVRLAPDSPCPCGLPKNGFELSRIEGRGDDCRNGVTPAEMDDVIDEPSLTAWQLDGKLLRVVGSDGKAAAERLSRKLGEAIAPRSETAILPEGSGKYRLVK